MKDPLRNAAEWALAVLKEDYPSATVTLTLEEALNGADILINSAQPKRPGQRCRCCNTRVVKDLIARYYERSDTGEAMPGLGWLTRTIRSQFGVSATSVRGHISRCLNR